MPESTRREFLKHAGQGAMAAGLSMHLPPGAWLTADTSANTSAAASEVNLECDVLVVGAGWAGCFAAIKAREQGAQVILVSKGLVGRSGQSPFSSGTLVFNPEWGHKLDEWMSYTNHVSEYLNHRYWSEISYTESYARFKECVVWGLPFRKGKDGNFERTPLSAGNKLEEIKFAGTPGELPFRLREQAVKAGVKIVDRVMVAELFKQNGRISGAVGLATQSNQIYTFVAKATILCVGACSLKPVSYPAIHQLTGDGEGMAYRAGAEILGKEFVDTHCCNMENGLPIGPSIQTFSAPAPGGPGAAAGQAGAGGPGGPGAPGGAGMPGGQNNEFTAEGTRLPDRPATASQYNKTYLQHEFEVHAGHGPLYNGMGNRQREMVGSECNGMSIRKADGLWPADKECRSNLPGLFAAGDAHGSMQNGAVYATNGSSSMGSMVTGAIAGTAAAKEAAKLPKPAIDPKEIARAKQFVTLPQTRKGGFSPRWVTQLLQNTMMPYFVSVIKRADRLQATLTQIEFMQEHLVPMLFARDAHELRLAHETRNMVLSAEIRLKSALFRTESRGNHFREDFPKRDDQNWMAWTKVRLEAGKMNLIKVPMPKEWWPDQSIPYQTRYPFRYPGES